MAAAYSLFICFILCFVCANCDILCEDGFCRTFVLDGGCSTPARECTINNATHSGIWLPSPTTCNCCAYCLPTYPEGHHCSLGGPGLGTTVGRCGAGLTCDNQTRTCVRMKTKCHDAQDDYDQRRETGETGALERRPICDEKGNYATFDCIPSQTCFCQSEEGERLFGELPYTGPSTNMPCRCSRLYDKVRQRIGPGVPYPVVGMRCTSDGNFNPVQCMDRKCYCVNKITGEATDDDWINLDEDPVSKLECYDPDLDIFPRQIEGDPPYEYTTPCYNTVIEKKELIERSVAEGYDITYFTTFNSVECMPDGTFGRITLNANGSKICVDEKGLPIQNYEAKPNTPEFENIDCRCALTTTLMHASNEPPNCCKNGNFRPIQCRRGMCRCVDADGRQVGVESSDVTKLTCYNQNWRNC